MNPTNESIGRSPLSKETISFCLERLIEVVEAAIESGDWKVDGACDPDMALRFAKRALGDSARELDRQAPGDAVRDAIAGRPAYLMGREHIEDENKPLCEIEYAATIQGAVMFHMKDKDADIPQPPAQEQGEVLDTLPDAAKWKAMPLHERLNIHAEGCALVCDESKDAVLSKHEIRAMHDDLREAISTLTRAAGAEDARDGVYERIVRRLVETPEGCIELAKVIRRELDRVDGYILDAIARCEADAAIASQAQEDEK